MKTLHRPTRRLPLAIACLMITGLMSPAQEANYDEGKVPDYRLPDPLAFEDGRKVESPEQWRERREELIRLFADHVYGRQPAQAAEVRLVPRVMREIPDFLEGRAVLKEIRLSFPEHPSATTLDLLLVLPAAADKPVPVFLGLNFHGNHTVHPDPRITLHPGWMRAGSPGTVDHRATEESRGTAAGSWPLEQILSSGYGVATLYCGDIDPDHDDGFTNGIHEVFGKPGTGEWATIASWAWGLSRGLDYLVADEQVDGGKVAVIGHSRLGKAALWAGALDERFAMVISNNSGCGGAALSRRAFGETVRRINTSFPHWFNDRFKEYNDNEQALPVDQHQLIALAAPRPVYVASASDDRWADPRGEFLAAKHAGAVYEMLGKEGVGTPEMPGIGESAGGHVGYHLREGGHGIEAWDWERYVAFANKHLR
jgi:hypothetical protein